MSNNFTKWVALWGNAVSITDRKECVYSKNLSLRYMIKPTLNGNKLRFHFNNFTGTEDVTLSKVTVAKSVSDSTINTETLKFVTFSGEKSVTMNAGGSVVSDEIEFDVNRNEDITVSIYLEDYTQMNAGVITTGPLSHGHYSYGDFTECEDLPIDLTRNTQCFYFLDAIDVLTVEEAHAVVCFGDSITAQSWPEYLTLRVLEEGIENVSIIRRAASGTRILRQYECITYQSYGLKGDVRFPYESEVSGADVMIIQHGINDIIHPVGVEINPFRPMSDMPTWQDLAEGVEQIYLPRARELGYKVYGGTLLPIYGWRTFCEEKNQVKDDFNNWIRNTDSFDGFIDFEKAIWNPENPVAFGEGMDSGDHLHPSEKAYKIMAYEVPKEIL